MSYGSFVEISRYNICTFLPIIGYVNASQSHNVLVSKIISLECDDNYSTFVYGDSPKLSSDGNFSNCKSNDSFTSKYFANADQFRHSEFRLTEENRKKLDIFCTSLHLFLQPHWYSALALNTGINNKDKKFHMHAFQRLMLLETIHHLITRCSLEEFRELIIMKMKEKIGIDWLTWNKSFEISNRFIKPISVHLVPRRHGKTTFTCALITLMLALFPSASIRCLYCAHQSHIPLSTYETIVHILPEIIKKFNRTQRTQYEKRKTREKLNIDKPDFYYVAVAEIKHVSQLVNVKFYIESDDDIQEKKQLFGTNILSCRVYHNKNVSNNIYLLLFYRLVLFRTSIL